MAISPAAPKGRAPHAFKGLDLYDYKARWQHTSLASDRGQSSNVDSRSELEDGAGVLRLCEAGPSSGKGSSLATVVVLAAVVVVGGVVVKVAAAVLMR